MYNNNPYLVSSFSSSTTDISSVSGNVLLAMVGSFLWVGIIILVLTIIAQWKIFTKAGEAGWKSLIPIYNSITLFKICGISPWWVLGYLASVIPVVGSFIVLGITIYLMIMLAKAFGKGAGFTVGLILLNTIFILILGLGDSKYQLNKEQKTESK